MQHIKYADSDSYPVAILIKQNGFHPQQIKEHYLIPEVTQHIPVEDFIVFPLKYNNRNKATVKFAREYLEELMPELASIGSKYLFCTDGTYFKILTQSRKSEPHLGYILPCKIKGYEHLQVILGVNHKALIYNPDNKHKLDLGLHTLTDALTGSESRFKRSFLQEPHYPTSTMKIALALSKAALKPFLACDIETASLRHECAGLLTIAFSWNQVHGTAFAVDYNKGFMTRNEPVRQLLREFFESYQGELRFHNSTFDIKILVYELWMEDGQDTAGLLKGLDIMTRHFHDTYIIAYLALNSTAGIELGLKSLAHEYAGNYAQDDIKQALQIPLNQLLEYNLVDACCTNYVYDKYYDKMIADKQLDIYNTLLMPSQKVIIQTELTGMPLSRTRVDEVELELEASRKACLTKIKGFSTVEETERRLKTIAWEKDFNTRQENAKNKKKIKPKDFDLFMEVPFNPNSSKHLQVLLYEVCGLPVLEETATGQAATGADVLNKLINHSQNDQDIKLMEELISLSKIEKILTTFITAFKSAVALNGTEANLHGSFKFGTKTGRLSSSNPNLQQIPSNSTYGKLVKSCFKAPQDWLFVGADFNSLEDMVSALTTKDPAKLKIYTENYDGHCLRAYAYFPEQMPDIQLAEEEEQCYSANVGGTDIQFKASDTINYQGRIYTGEELYDCITNRRI